MHGPWPTVNLNKRPLFWTVIFWNLFTYTSTLSIVILTECYASFCCISHVAIPNKKRHNGTLRMAQDCNQLGLEHWFAGVILERNCTVNRNFVNSVCFQSKFVWLKFMWVAPVFLACRAKNVQVALNKRSQCMTAIHPSNSTSYLASISSTQNVYLQAGGICHSIIKFMFHFS